MSDPQLWEYECANPDCAMVGHIDSRPVCLGCRRRKQIVTLSEEGRPEGGSRAPGAKGTLLAERPAAQGDFPEGF